VEVLLHGKVYWQVWSVSKKAMFGGLEMVLKLVSGKIVGYPQTTT
jgi:hypothetical protein